MHVTTPAPPQEGNLDVLLRKNWVVLYLFCVAKVIIPLLWRGARRAGWFQNIFLEIAVRQLLVKYPALEIKKTSHF